MATDRNKVTTYLLDEQNSKLEKAAKSLNISKSKFLAMLIDSYNEYQQLKAKSEKIQFGELDYNNIGLKVIHNEDGSIKENQVEIVDKAMKNSGQSLQEIVRDGTLQRSRYLNSIAKKQAKFESLSDEELKEKTFKGAAYHRIEKAIETIKNHNNSQSNKNNKVCLTRGMVFKLTNSNRQTINKFFDEYHQTIDDHNHKHNLTNMDNRKGKNFSFEKLLEIE